MSPSRTSTRFSISSGREDVEVVEHVAQVDDDAGAVAPFDRHLVDGLAVGDKVARRVQVRAHVVGGLDVLRVDAVFGFALDVLDLERRVERPERAVLVERLGEIVDFHGILLQKDEIGNSRLEIRDSGLVKKLIPAMRVRRH